MIIMTLPPGRKMKLGILMIMYITERCVYLYCVWYNCYFSFMFNLLYSLVFISGRHASSCWFNNLWNVENESFLQSQYHSTNYAGNVQNRPHITISSEYILFEVYYLLNIASVKQFQHPSAVYSLITISAPLCITSDVSDGFSLRSGADINCN